MTAAALHRSDYEASRRRTRVTMSTSMVVHALLMLWIVSVKSVATNTPEITEITMIDPGDLAAPAASAPASASAARTSPGARTASTVDQRFTRVQREADFVPEPQSSSALEDRLAAQVASLESPNVSAVASSAAKGVPGGAWGPASAATGTGTGSGPIALTRGGAGGSGTSLSLTRGGGTSIGPAMVSTGIPSEGSAASAPAKGGESTARRNLAGATLMGPIADRAVISYAAPLYPEWAKRDAIEGVVTLYFVVRPDGSIKENILVQKTAGFEEFDENARVALKAWRFQALTGGRTGEQWGTITFRYRIREAG